MSTRWITLRDISYADALARQHEVFDPAVESRRLGNPVTDDTIFFVEHRPVYTLGRNGHPENLISRQYLADRGAELIETDRGGDITFHGPGQLVVYPIIDLQRHHLGVKAYVDRLEQSVIDAIARYGIEGRRVEGATGVWIGKGCDERKICAIGIRCSRFITMHGLALNVTTDIGWFSAINPCGFTNRGVTSIACETGRNVSFDEIAAIMKETLTENLQLL